MDNIQHPNMAHAVPAPVMDSHKEKDSLKNVFSWIFVAMSFLLPLVFYPGVADLTYSIKLAMLVTFSAVCVLVFLLNVISSGEIEFPRSKLGWALILLPLSAVVSAFFSGNLTNSFVGTVFEIGTAVSYIMFFILFIISILAGSKEKFLNRFIFGFLSSIGLVLLYTLFVTLAQYGWFSPTGMPVSLVGSFTDLSILLGVSLLLTTCMLSFSDHSKKIKIFLWIITILSILIIGAIGFVAVEIMLGLLSLMMFTYLISISRNSGSSWVKHSYATLIVLLTSIIFVISGSGLSGALSNLFKINSLEVRPNMSSTMGIIKSEWAKNPITGGGPNKFVEMWALYKPVEVNTSDFWGTDFFFSSATFFTIAATLGVLGVLSLLFFLFLFIKNGSRVFFSPDEDKQKRFLAISIFLPALYLWIITFVYSSGLTVLALTFIFTGLFVASLTNMGIVRNIRINIFSNPKANFVSVFSIVVVMIGVVTASYFAWDRIAASMMFGRAVASFNRTGDIDAAKASIDRIVATTNSDSYSRALAEINLLNIEKIAGSIPAGAKDLPQDVSLKLQNSVALALQAGNKAIALNPTNYQNYVTVARIFESLATKGIAGASKNARDTYAQVAKLNPANPAVNLAFARLSVLDQKLDEAKDFANKAIALKPNYSDAYFLLAQLEASTNNVAGAIKAVEATALLNPGNAGLFFQLGLLKYQTQDFLGASQALERAIAIAPDYANAKYFLGLSYFKLNKVDSAVAQFESLQTTNQDNAEIKLILTNLKAGKDPFAGAKPPVDAKPQARKELPVKDAQ